MTVSNLLKHKIRFKQSGHDSDRDEPCIPSKGYHYISNRIQNGESVGIRNVCDLFIDKLKPLSLHIISTMYYEAEMEIDSITITVIVWDDETSDDYDVVKYEFTKNRQDCTIRKWKKTNH